MKRFRSDSFIAFSYRDFRTFWLGQFISTIGSQMLIVGLNWHMYLLTKSALALGLIGLIRFLPIVAFSLVGGGVADSFNRKKILYITQTILGLCSLFLAFQTFTHTINASTLYAITALASIAMSFDTPSRQSFIPSLVPRKDLGNAMSLNAIMWQTGQILGPAVSGFIIAFAGVGNVYLFDAISYIAVILALIHMSANGAIDGEKIKVSFTSIKQGLSFVRSETIIWSTMLLDFFSTFFSSAYALLPIYAQDILHVGPQGLGFLYAAPSIGAVLAGFAMAHMHRIKKQGELLLAAVAVYGAATVLFGASKFFATSLFALFLVGAGDSISTIIRNTVRQLVTPDSIRGRMTSVNMIFFMGGPQLGDFESGALASLVGAPTAVIIGGFGTLLAVGIMTYAIPRLRTFRLPSHEDKIKM